jgi:surface protein
MKTSVNTTRELGQFKTSINKGIYEGNTPHISEWRTTTPNETVTLPYTTNGVYNGIIDWGDGTQSVNSYDNRTHTYASAGYYIITITGRIRIFRFANAGDRTKLYKVFQWGSQFDVGVGGSHFHGCTNLNLSVVSDVLILYRPFVTSNTSTFANMFRDCTSLTTINRVDEWDVSNINNLQACFFQCPNFNGNVSSWNVSNVTNFQSCFANCTNFTQNVGGWNVLAATNMSFMFQNATNFNQNIDNWDIRNVTVFSSFMAGKTFSNYSTANYDALLIGWASRPVQPNISISFGTIKRTAAGTASRLILTSAPNNWTIVDGGL